MQGVLVQVRVLVPVLVQVAIIYTHLFLTSLWQIQGLHHKGTRKVPMVMHMAWWQTNAQMQAILTAVCDACHLYLVMEWQAPTKV